MPEEPKELEEARRLFFEATGKTPEEESRDSVRALGLGIWTMLAALFGVVVWALVRY